MWRSFFLELEYSFPSFFLGSSCGIGFLISALSHQSLSLPPVSLSQSLSWPWTLLDPFIKTKLHNTTKAEVFFELYNKENGQSPKEAEKPFPLFFLIMFTDTVGFKRNHKHSLNHDPIDLPRILTFQTHLWSYSFSKFHYPLN